MSKPGNAWRRVRGAVTGKPSNFSWVVEDGLAGSGKPFSREEFDWVRGQDVECIITMTEEALPEGWTADLAEYLHVPTPDLHAPAMEGIVEAVDFARKNIESGRRVMVHCHAGMGRAGTILACYLVKHAGLSAEEAVSRIRRERPGSIQSPEQEEVIAAYERRVRGPTLD